MLEDPDVSVFGHSSRLTTKAVGSSETLVSIKLHGVTSEITIIFHITQLQDFPFFKNYIINAH